MKRRNRENSQEENMSHVVKSRFLTVLGGLIVLAALAPEMRADGFIIPNPRHGEIIPPLTVKYHHVTVEIVNQVAKTSVDQVFVNNFALDIEGTYIFPIPEGASISEFAMYIGNERVRGEILDSQRARHIYEDIVRRMRDPGLLEYIGRNMFQARVYPIPARGEKRVQISYTEVLKSENSLVKYLYPLNTERFSRDPLKEVSLSARIESQVPILNVYSPSHRISVRQEGESKASVGYEDADIKPDRDFVLYYSLSKDDVGLSFMNWPGAEGGYFMLLASPRYAVEKDKVIAKSLVLVLDSSGSMRGNKIRQVKAAARFIVQHLGQNDLFSLIDFDDSIALFSESLVPADRDHVDKALKFIDAIEDSGGTNINDALTKGLRLMRSSERPNYVLFLTDGQPTVGTTETPEILKNIGRANEPASRLFVFGVGDDVNTELLGRLSSDQRGVSVYVSENEDIEAAVSGFYEKVSSPLLSDLAVSFRGIETSSVYPQALPDLFKGSQLVLVGKYRGDGPATVVLKGKVGGLEKRFVLEGRRLSSDQSSNFLPRLWATRRIGYLLEEIRLGGPKSELVDEVKRLGLKYGIVTPYTSFLVTEREKGLLPAAAPEARDAMAARQVSGGFAVKAAKISNALKAEDMAARAASTQIMYKEDKTLLLKDGVWVDSEYKEGSPVREIRFNSDEYYRLVIEKPGIVKYLSAGAKLIIVYQDVNYKIVE
jgi:Ca-activated chloride channel family protein